LFVSLEIRSDNRIRNGSFFEAMPGSLSVANTAVSSANVAVVDSVDVGRSVTVVSDTAPGVRPH
jgi:hypothetical protein